jgi:acyl dehydratase
MEIKDMFTAQGADPHQAKVGEELGPIEYVVTEELVRDYGDGADDHDPWFFQDSPFGGRIAHPTIVANDYAVVLATKYSMDGAVHAKAAHEFINPIRLGKRLKVKGKIVDMYNKRGRDYLTVETVAVDEDGVELAKSRNTWLLATERRDAK